MQAIVKISVSMGAEPSSTVLMVELETFVVPRIIERPAFLREDATCMLDNSIDRVNLIACFEETPREVASDKARRTSNQYSFHSETSLWKILNPRDSISSHRPPERIGDYCGLSFGVNDVLM
jgi:hypothetical protein